MTEVFKVIATLILICIFPEARSQVYEQSFLAGKLPKIPATVVNITVD